MFISNLSLYAGVAKLNLERTKLQTQPNKGHPHVVITHKHSVLWSGLGGSLSPSCTGLLWPAQCPQWLHSCFIICLLIMPLSPNPFLVPGVNTAPNPGFLQRTWAQLHQAPATPFFWLSPLTTASCSTLAITPLLITGNINQLSYKA